MKLQDLIGSWGEMFDSASFEEKKGLISTLVKEVHLNGSEVKVVTSLDVPAFWEVVASLQLDDNRGPNGHSITGTDILNPASIKRTFTTPIQHITYIKVA